MGEGKCFVNLINKQKKLTYIFSLSLELISEGQAIWMDENIRYGKTDRCTTFNNPPLCPSGDFEIRVLEVYGFVGA